MSEPHPPVPDEQLVQLCQEGDQAAWRLLYQRQHAKLLRSIARILDLAPADDDLAEEIAARVWCSLVVRDGWRLRAFDPRRGSLAVYLAALARQEIQAFYRAQAARPRLDLPLRDGQAVDRAAPWLLGPLLEGFVARLSPQERRFFHETLLGNAPDPPAKPLSPANSRKLKERVLHKLHAFLQTDREAAG